MSEDRKAISKLYNGEYYFAETPLPRTAEYMNCVRKLNELTKILVELLNDAQSSIFEDYTQEQGKLNAILYEHYFKEGFSVATKLIFDGMKK